MTQTAVLMSIKPEYANMIFDGRKTIELRRVCPKVRQGDLVLVYASGPRKALVGVFEVQEVVSAPPASLCRAWLTESGVTKDVFLTYFSGRETAFGIRIGKTWRLPAARPLKTLRRLRGGFRPPQSYRYLRAGEFDLL
jgi:predicted transcriptional regulator